MTGISSPSSPSQCQAHPRTCWLAIRSLACGLAGFCAVAVGLLWMGMARGHNWFVVGQALFVAVAPLLFLVGGIAGVVWGRRSLSRIRAEAALWRGKGVAIVGIVLSVLGIGIIIVAVCVFMIGPLVWHLAQ
jgi:hypothetical protein